MALTKLPKSAFGTGSVDDSKIEDGTIQAVEVSGTISADKLNSTQDLSSKTVTLPNTSVTSDQIVNTTIANAKLSNSTITIRGTSISLGGSATIGVEVNWQSVQTTGFTAVAGNGYFVDTTSGAITVTLPASATLGDQIAIKDYAGTFASNNLTIGRNGHNIQGVANDSVISTNRASVLLVYVDSTKGWIYAEESNVSSLLKATFTSATGGTVTESGDYKIHTFTGDGCFVVSTAGNSPVVPTGGPSNVDYLVIAGGGGASSGLSGGGGAGGYRTSYPTCGGALLISATTYPITVGGGGAGNSCNGQIGANGSNSIFSTITSAGGGAGAGVFYPGGGSGGSGGGGGGFNARPGGSGNTPPVSPPQGNNGGSGQPTCANRFGGGGGGASAVGQSNTAGADGGAGSSNSISGSSVNYAGGGAGGGEPTSPAVNPNGAGGPYGGGNGGIGIGQAGGNGTANTGGGGGGGGPGGSQSGGSGGKGIVIIRYKFQ